jgi:hypothetical protein
MGYVVFTAIMAAWFYWAFGWVRAYRKAAGIRARSSILATMVECERAAAAKEGREMRFPMSFEEMDSWRDGLSTRLLIPASFDRSLVKV